MAHKVPHHTWQQLHTQHLPALTQLLTLCRWPVQPHRIAAELSVPAATPAAGASWLWFGAQVRQKLIAALNLRACLEQAELGFIGVHPEHTRKGVGCAAFAWAQRWACNQGCKTLWLEVSCNNAAATALYRKMGCTQDGKRPKYYPDGSDAVLMSCPLSCCLPGLLSDP